MNKKNKKGFTLVELLAVIVVLIIILLIAINFVRSYTKKSKENTLRANTLSYIKAINGAASVDVLENKTFKSAMFNSYGLINNNVKVKGTQPDDALVCLNDYEVTSACLNYGKYKVNYKDGKIESISKGKCKLKSFACQVTPLEVFEYSGDYQEFIAPHDGDYRIDLWGAQGGSAGSAPGGKGAYTSGIIHLDENDKIYIYVGGQGQEKSYLSGSTGTSVGGYNGGAVGNISRTNCYQSVGSGGGATDVRLVSGSWSDVSSLTSRIMVAAGGAGSFTDNCGTNDNSVISGGYGGALEGGTGSYIGTYAGFSSLNPKGGTQTTGGRSVNEWNRTWYEDTYLGTFGKGATGASSYGGGGGGYWGGASGNWQPGAGGSSYISGYKGCVAVTSKSSSSPKSGCSNGTSNIDCSMHYSGIYFRETVMKSGIEEMPSHNDLSTITGNEGNGYAIVYDGYHIDEKLVYSNESEEYAYTGSQKVFIAPRAGTYKLEVWGAQGGSYSDTYYGGYGGYSIGYVNLQKGAKLYVNVGGKGTDLNKIVSGNNYGGYNGGGSSYTITSNCSNYSGSGGGATSISTKIGIISNLSDNLNQILIVAGGGGGSSYRYCSDSDYAYSSGGAGGGISGSSTGNTDNYWPYTSATGGTQTEGGVYGTSNGESGGTNGSFGLGGQTSRTGGYTSGTGGGGGLYGGANGMFVGAGGGSGYIGNSLLSNKEMKCYNCTESTDDDTKTTSVDCAEETANPNCAKKGNGYAKITFISE